MKFRFISLSYNSDHNTHNLSWKIFFHFRTIFTWRGIAALTEACGFIPDAVTNCAFLSLAAAGGLLAADNGGPHDFVFKSVNFDRTNTGFFCALRIGVSAAATTLAASKK